MRNLLHSLANHFGPVSQKDILGLVKTAKALQPSNIALDCNLCDVSLSEVKNYSTRQTRYSLIQTLSGILKLGYW